MALDYREEAFVIEYIKNEGSCYAAAIAAGYAESTARNAYRWLDKEAVQSSKKNTYKYKPELAAAIEERREQLKSELVADAQEIMEFHTRVLREQVKEEVPMVVGVGPGCSTIEMIEKPASIKDKQASAVALAKILGLEKANLNVEGAVPVQFTGVNDLED